MRCGLYLHPDETIHQDMCKQKKLLQAFSDKYYCYLFVNVLFLDPQKSMVVNLLKSHKLYFHLVHTIPLSSGNVKAF